MDGLIDVRMLLSGASFLFTTYPAANDSPTGSDAARPAALPHGRTSPAPPDIRVARHTGGPTYGTRPSIRRRRLMGTLLAEQRYRLRSPLPAAGFVPSNWWTLLTIRSSIDGANGPG